MKFLAALILLIVLVCVAPCSAEEPIIVGGWDGLDPDMTEESYQVALALSGGGARGFSSVGVLKAFEERNVRVIAIAGTSMGGIVGGLYACGYTPDELIDLIEDIDFVDLLANRPARSSMFLTQRQARERHILAVRFDGIRPSIPQGLTAGQKLTALLSSLTVKANYLAGQDFSRLPIPFRTICTDIVTGQKVVLRSGSLADAMRATMAFPLAFTAVEDDERLLMDGGMVAPVPVSDVRSLHNPPAYVVAVNTSSPLLTREELLTPVDIANQVTSIMTAYQLQQQLDLADYVITPPLSEFASADFKHKRDMIELGYRAGLTAADSIIACMRASADSTTFVIVDVTADDRSDDFVAGVAHRLLNRRLTREQLISELKTITRENDLLRLEAFLESSPVTADESSDAAVQKTLRLIVCPALTVTPESIQFQGNQIFDDTALRQRMAGGTDRINYRNLPTALDSIISLYRSNGYDLAEIRTVTFDSRDRRMIIELDEAVIKRIDVANNQVTRDWLVRSYFPLKVGQPYSTEQAAQGLSNIYGTDLFDRVTLDVLPYIGGAIVRIGVKEKLYSQVRLGWHWDDAYQSEEFVELLNDNMFGVGLESLLHARYGNDRQQYFAQLRANRIFSTYLTARLRLFHDRLNRTIFGRDESLEGIRHERRTGGMILVGQQLARLGTVNAGLSIEEVEYEDERSDTEERFGLRSITIQSLLETLDRATFPESGNNQLIQLQFAGKVVGGDVEYTRFFSSFEAYVQIGKVLNYHPKVSLGISRTGLPPSEQFFIGGLHSFSGYRTYQVYGDKVFLLNHEFRVKLPLRFYLFGRYDMGEVYSSTDEIKLRNLRHGVGVSIAFDSPIGPFEFGYGIADGDDDRYYFQAGFDF